MKKFLIYIFSWLVFVFVFLEITIRLFGLVGEQKPKEIVEGNKVLKPGAEGYWVRGGLAEIDSYFSINNKGFNSMKDYELLNNENINVAIIGDSYIEGFHVDVNLSIGRQLEKIIGSAIVVHEYGIAGANVADYNLVCKDYIKDKNYDYVFIYITDEDLKKAKPSFMRTDIKKNIGNKEDKISITSFLYNNVYTYSYLNINHGLQKNFVSLIKNGPESIAKIHNKDKIVLQISKEEYLNEINKTSISDIPNDVVFVYEEGKLDTRFINYFDYEFLNIKHIKKPYDFGFDKHWNTNGRYNFAKTIAEYIKNK